MRGEEERCLRAIYFEDLPGAATRYAIHFKAAWEALQNGISLRLEVASSFQECTSLLENGEWDLLIADLLATSEEAAGEVVEIGIELISATRNTASLGGKEIGILAFSLEAKLRGRALSAGADDFFLKHDLRGGAPSYAGLQTTLQQILRSKDFDLTPSKTWSLSLKEADLAAEATVWRVGLTNLEEMISSLVGGEVRKAEISSIRSGLSGADILLAAVEFKPTAGRSIGARKELVLKISKSREHIERERQGLLYARSVFPDSVIPTLYSGEQIASSGRHHAIAFSSISSAQTLLAWLAENAKEQPEKPKVIELDLLLSEIFLEEGLSSAWGRRSTDPSVRPSTGIWNVLDPQRRAAIRLGLSDLEPLFELFGKSYWDPVLTENFLNESRRIGNLDEVDVPIGKGLDSCISHGDLHGRNILVDHRKRGWIIDGGNIGEELPWPCDLARMTVDILLSGLDFGAEGHLWERFDDWCVIIDAFVGGKPLAWEEDSRNCLVLYAAQWLRSMPRELMEVKGQESPEWQLCLAYAVEFLRNIYRSADMPTPKRVLAGIGASIAIRNVEVLLGAEASPS